MEGSRPAPAPTYKDGNVASNEVVCITRVIEFDMGHRIPNHKSKCRNMHGHRYKLEVDVAATLVTKKGDSSQGMVVDFGDLKAILTRLIHDPFDHGFAVYEGDGEVLKAMKCMPLEHNTVVVPFIPTAENLALHFRDLLEDYFTSNRTPFVLSQLRLYETPNSIATVHGRHSVLRDVVR